MKLFPSCLLAFALCSSIATATTSLENRQEKSLSLNTEMGTSVYPHPTAGFSLSYFVSPDVRLEANYTRGSIDFFDEMGSKLYSARVKYFLGNSLYVNTGVAYRELTLVLNDWLFSSGHRIERNINHYGAEISLGNSWQFSSFTIGCDWAGYFVPIKKTKDTREESGEIRSIFGATSTEPEDDESDRESENRWEDYANSGTYQAVRFNIGWSF